ncbi:hypothetical protein E1292_16845 [Nonomuraea deserti]|uniref:Uncharacterized protein n=1 Tax=Nonomuraea deserti TaxID=1848322 RepID=A0A4R4VQW6_9ACTN|nr:hypothetical protein [Nonomuraea deserti]TDD05543.1 hypothetical protein E1292_16845 [Nonomuraea deserti]
MPKFHDLSEYAATIAQIIDAAHVNLHAAALRSVTDLAESSGVTPGLLVDLRFTLPLRPLTRPQLATLYRYGDAALPELDDHLREGTMTEDPGGRLRPTREGLAFIHRLYDLHAAAAERVWAGHDLPALANLAGRVLDSAERVPGGALEVAAPPYEPEGTSPGVLLFNRIAALRHHRADAHATAWQAEGLTAAGIVALADGPLRAGIEAETNLRAAAPYRILSADERDTLRGGLLKLV